MDEQISQAKMQTIFVPMLKRNGLVYEKYRHVLAKIARGGEHIVSATSDGNETQNTAEPGDYIVQNQTTAQEWYIVSKEKFQDRYAWIADLDTGLAKYKPKGKVVAVQLKNDILRQLELTSVFHFEAPWGASQIAREDDFIVTLPDFSQVYRIGRQEFEETYVAVAQ